MNGDRMQFVPSPLSKDRRPKSTGVWLSFLLGSFCGFVIASLIFVHVGTIQRLQTAAPPQDKRWKQIDVYVGDAPSPRRLAEASTISNEYFFRTQWYSQVQQDYVVSRLLKGKRNGYFVDLAANDAVKISNTFALERHFGWRGLAIEPNAVYWAGLAYRQCDVVAAVIGAQNGEERTFHFPKRAAPKGGLVGSAFDNKQMDKAQDEYQTRSTVTLLEVFRRYNTPPVIDYLSLDVEGAEELIMESFPFSSYRFNVITLERPSQRLKLTLSNNGYKMLKELKNWGETLWVHRSIMNSVDLSALDVDTEHYKYKESQ